MRKNIILFLSYQIHLDKITFNCSKVEKNSVASHLINDFFLDHNFSKHTKVKVLTRTWLLAIISIFNYLDAAVAWLTIIYMIDYEKCVLCHLLTFQALHYNVYSCALLLFKTIINNVHFVCFLFFQILIQGMCCYCLIFSLERVLQLLQTMINNFFPKLFKQWFRMCLFCLILFCFAT